jgi:protein gp37
MTPTKIQWADATLNAQVGCSKVSAGCKNCYAIRHAHRMAGNPNPKIGDVYRGLTKVERGKLNWTGEIVTLPDRFIKVARRTKPTVYFVNSMSDLFHPSLRSWWIDVNFNEFKKSPHHTFLILTKHPQRAADYMAARYPKFKMKVGTGGQIERQGPPANVWLGVSIEDRAALSRLILRDIPAAVRFLSLEPLLEDLGEIDLTGIGWVIAGGESGPGARMRKADWFRSIRDQCVAARVPFFFKQWGAGSLKLSEYAAASLDHGGNCTLDDGRAMLDGFIWDQRPPTDGSAGPAPTVGINRASGFDFTTSQARNWIK